MSLQSVRDFLAAHAPDIEVLVLDQSTATVAEAAAGHGVPPDQIAKTLSLRVGERVILVVASGLSRLDNKKAKAAFGGKIKMLDLSDVEAVTGHPVGGVCPFGVRPGVLRASPPSRPGFTASPITKPSRGCVSAVKWSWTKTPWPPSQMTRRAPTRPSPATMSRRSSHG